MAATLQLGTSPSAAVALWHFVTFASSWTTVITDISSGNSAVRVSYYSEHITVARIPSANSWSARVIVFSHNSFPFNWNSGCFLQSLTF